MPHASHLFVKNAAVKERNEMSIIQEKVTLGLLSFYVWSAWTSPGGIIMGIFPWGHHIPGPGLSDASGCCPGLLLLCLVPSGRSRGGDLANSLDMAGMEHVPRTLLSKARLSSEAGMCRPKTFFKANSTEETKESPFLFY